MASGAIREEDPMDFTMESRVGHWVESTFLISPFIVGHTLMPNFPIYSAHNKISKNEQ